MELDASLVIDPVSRSEIKVGQRYFRIHIIVGQKPQRLSHHSVIMDLLYVLVLEDEDGRWLVWYAAVGNIRLGSLIPKMLHIADEPINSTR